MTPEPTAAGSAKHRARRVLRLAAAACAVALSLGALGAMAPPRLGGNRELLPR